MDTGLLVYFQAVADSKSISRAAEMLFVSQPTLSRKIHILEETLGVQLFHRSYRSMELTEAGFILYGECAHIKSIIDEVKIRMFKKQSSDVGNLNITSESLNYSRLQFFLRDFKKIYSNTSVSIYDCPFRERMKELDNGKTDMAIVRSFNCDSDEYREKYDIYRLYHTRMSVVFSWAHRLASRGSIRLEELKGEPLLFINNLDLNSPFYSSLVARSGGVPVPDPPATLENLFFRLVCDGGFAFIEYHTGQRHAAASDCFMLELNNPDVFFDVVAVISKENTNPDVEAFLSSAARSFPRMSKI